MTSNYKTPPTSPPPVVRGRTEGVDLAVAPEMFLTDAGPDFRSRPYRIAVTDLRSISERRLGAQ